MNTKVSFLNALLALCLATWCIAEDRVSIGKTNEEWRVHTYPEIGLRIRLPDWKADTQDDGRSWSLLAYPLVENPVADVQYRVVISANKYTESQYLRLIRNYATNSADWSNQEHLQTSQMTNAFWIYIRRDIWCPGGFSYPCTGRIKRDAQLKPKDVNRLDADEEKLAAAVYRILDSIELVSTNATKAP
jgi:hypothetical protein